MKHEHNLCLNCIYSLPKTRFWDYKDSPVEKLFWGRIPVAAACSFLHFEKENIVQQMMHKLKYEGKTGIGEELGMLFATSLVENDWFSDLDIIIPVPLHASKQARRGYNQSTFIANGMAQVYKVESSESLLVRTVSSQTQTRKGRYQRSENVSSIFQTPSPNLIKGKNVLLVDDVVTTGATLVSAGSKLVEAGVNKLYIATLAIA